MSAEGVFTVPRNRPRMLVGELVARDALTCSESDLDVLPALIRAHSTPHVPLRTRGEFAAQTARSLVHALHEDARFRPAAATADILTPLLKDVLAR